MSGSVTIMEMPALGRQFQLGMLYDATTDKLIQGQELWDKDAIQNAQKDTPFIDTQFSVIADDSLSTKSQHLGATGGIKMNLLAGLVNVSGAAEYYNDQKSTRQVVRVTMHSKFHSQKQEIDIQQLGPVKDPAIISATRATHVVSGILFGLEAFLVIDRPYSVEEESQIVSIQSKTTACARLLAGMYDSGKTDINETESSACKFKLHCDFSLPVGTSLSNLEEAKTFLIEQFFPLAKQGSKSISLVPKKIWLYPLTELDSSAASLTHSISNDIISQIEEINENLTQAEVWINDIQKNNSKVCCQIQCFQQQQTRLMQLLNRFQSELMQQLSDLIPKIRNGLASNDELSSLLKQIGNSPFFSNNLTTLLKGIEQETRVVTLCLKSIDSVKLVNSDDLESLGYEFDYILSFEFRVGCSHNTSLDQMDEYLRSKEIINDHQSKVVPWYKDGTKKRAIQMKAKTFKEFAQINNQKDDITFVVSINNGTSNCEKEGAAIVLFADESPVEFDLPSKPLDIRAAHSANNEVTLSWNKPKLGADNILSYRVCHRPAKNPPDEWIFTNTSGAIETQTLTQLSPDCMYEFGVQTKCKVGFSITSEIVTFKIPLAQTKLETPPMTATLDDTPKLESASSFSSLPTSDLESSSSHTLVIPEEPTSASNFPTTSQLMSSPQALISLGGLNYGLLQSASQLVPSEAEHPFSMEHPPARLNDHQLQRLFLESQLLALRGYQQYPPFHGMDNPNSGYHTPSKPASARLIPSTGTPQSEQDEWKMAKKPSMHVLIPLARNITHKSVELKWMPPDTEADGYTIYYHQQKDPDNTLKKISIDGQADHCIVNGLTHDTRYIFKLHAKLSSGMSLESDETDVVKTPPYLPLKIRSKCKLLAKKTKEQPAMYELKKEQTMQNKEKKVAKFKVGTPIQHYPEKVLMLVGATGAGKTTLINGIANYMYGVQWDDDFRFVLVDNEPKKSQAHSQTSWITAYTLHRASKSPIPYSLTIIDTPGFGDTEGIERDKKIVSQIKDFFSIKPPEGIDVLHGIGFVAQASLARLTQSQIYIFDSILSIYGKDVASNIFMMTTFADGQLPPVLEAIEVAKIPHQTYFKFNNSALFVRGDEDSFDAMFWKMGVKSFTDFFVEFNKAESRSLQLTREVLDEREQLENVLKELQPQIRAGLAKMDELQIVVTALQRNKALIEQNKDFAFKVKVTKQRKVDTPPGRYTTNCLNCNYTCHENCKIADNDKKRGCWAMNRYSGDCRICPDNCIWSKHVNNPYIFVLYEEEEVKNSAELKERYDTAKKGESSAEAMISNIKGEVEYLENDVLEMVDKARKSLMRLDEIALKPNPLSEVDYIDKLIASEEMQQKPGYNERISSYRQLRKRAELLRQIKTHDGTDAQGPIFSMFGDGTTTYSSATIEVLAPKKNKKSKFRIPWIQWSRN